MRTPVDGTTRMLRASPLRSSRRSCQRAAYDTNAATVRFEIDRAVADGRRFFIGAYMTASKMPSPERIAQRFADLYGATPGAYYRNAVVERVRELRRQTPRIKRAWLVLRTGATEEVIDIILRQLDGEQTAETA